MNPRMVLARAMAAGLAFRLDDQGTVRVTGRATPDLLAALRAHKAAIAELLATPPPSPELADILAAFPGSTVELRAPSPIPDEPKLGDWVWSQPLSPRRRRW